MAAFLLLLSHGVLLMDHEPREVCNMKEILLLARNRFSRSLMRKALTMFFVLASSFALNAMPSDFYIHDQQYRFAHSDSRCSVQKLCYATTVLGEDNLDYSMNFVEFNDKGELFEQGELDAAIKQLNDARQNDGTVIVFIYIHGWHNNAGSRDQGKSQHNCGDNLYTGDVAKFENCGLKKIAETSRPTTPGKAPRVVGIYLAWHGTDFTLLPLIVPYYVPSYIFRRHYALTVGRTGMEPALRQILDVIRDHRKSYFVIAMGHSFGARALENADLVLDPKNTNPPKGLQVAKNPRQAENQPQEQPPLRPQLQPVSQAQPQLQPPPEPALEPRIEARPELQLQPPLGLLPSAELPIDLVFYVNAATSRYRTIRTVHDWDKQCKQSPSTEGCKEDPLYYAVSSRADVLTAIVMPIANFVFPAWTTDHLHLISAANTPWTQTHSIPERIPAPPQQLPANAFCFVTHDGHKNYLYEVKPKTSQPTIGFWLMNSDHWYTAVEGILHKIPALRKMVRHDWIISAHGDVWNGATFSMVHALIDEQSHGTKGALTCYGQTQGMQFAMH